MTFGMQLAAVPVLIGLNAFFVAGEYAVVAAKPVQIEALRRMKRWRTAAAMDRFKAAPASAIGTIQVCITMTNLMLGWIGEPAMSALLSGAMGPLVERWPTTFTGISVALSFLIVTLLTVVLSELLPKALTMQYVIPAATLTAFPVSLIQQALRPLVWLMNAIANAVTIPLGLGRVDDMETEIITRDELRSLSEKAASAGQVSAREQALIASSLAFSTRRAKEIRVPRTQVAFLDLRKTMEENRGVINEQLYSRLPLCDGGMDNVIGLVHTTEFLSAYHEAGDVQVLQLIARKPIFAPETVTLDRLLEMFHDQQTEFIFLVDEYGGIEGIVTLHDVVDELVGEIHEASKD